VLASVTTNLPILFDQLEIFAVPYSARGGKLYLNQLVVQQLILGLRAIADASDGVAQAALFRPPFFAVDLADLAAGRLEDLNSQKSEVRDAALRHSEARDLVRNLRRERFSGLPSATARKLIEQTAFERTVALLPNGQQNVSAVREMLAVMDRMVMEQGLDFDGVTRILRKWIDAPIQLDPPSSAKDSINVLTIHQAKGLEFPVVVIWDGFAARKGSTGGNCWTTAAEGKEWAIGLENFRAESENADQFVQLERAVRQSERERLYYVAATRTRDLLVLPAPQVRQGGQMLTSLWQGEDNERVQRFEAFQPDHAPAWAAGIEPVLCFPELDFHSNAADSHGARTVRWQQQRDLAAKPIAVPVAVTTLAHGAQTAVAQVATTVADITDDATDQPQRLDSNSEAEARQTSRFGPQFGDTVHRALSLILGGDTASVEQVVRACAEFGRLDEHIDEAIADVERTLRALDQAGLRRTETTLYPEYPVNLLDDEGQMVVGFIDLLVMTDAKVTTVDFKTDQPPAISVDQDYPAYKRQVTTYAEIVSKILTTNIPVEARLLFTANGDFVLCN
jgi:ATP-dependent helicase/nuclease subunit A